MKELILGGARSGKSALALEKATQSGKQVVFIATATASDEEMAERIARHQAERPLHWQLVEEPLQLANTLSRWASEERCLVVDCLTLWLNNLLSGDPLDEYRLQCEQQALLNTLATLKGHIILVSNEVGLGIVPLGNLSRRFCDESGRLHQQLATLCERVTLTVAGLPHILKNTQDISGATP